MAGITYHITGEMDKNIIKNAIEFSEQNSSGFQGAILILISNPQFKFNELENIKEDESLNNILNKKSTLIEKFIFRYSDYQFTIARLPDSPFDKLVFTSDLHQNNIDDGIAASQDIILLRSKFKAFDQQKVLKNLLGKETSQYYQERENQLQRFESTVEGLMGKMTENIIQIRAQLEEEYNLKKESLENQLNKTKDDQDKYYEKRKRELDDREVKLNAKFEEIDNSENKHARRAIRENIKNEIKENFQKFELTKGTQQRRYPVWLIAVILLGISAYLLIISTNISSELLSAGNSSNELIVFIIKQLIYGLAFGATAVFLIRWQNHWFQQHAREEFRLKRLNLDLDRASWVVEMAFEWQTEKGTEIPKELIEQLTRNLFVDPNQVPEDSVHPADHLASTIFGASTEATIELPGGSKLRLDRKAIQRLKSDSESN